MVLVAPKTWLSDLRSKLAGGEDNGSSNGSTLGILAFEAAAAMARVVSLQKTLADGEFRELRSTTMRSDGVAYLNSSDQGYLLRLACAEILSELDAIAGVVSRLGGRTQSPLTRGFSRVYADVKSGNGGADMVKFLKESGKRMKKMEKYVDATARLYDEMDALKEVEALRHSGPIPKTGPPIETGSSNNGEMKSRRQKAIRRLMEESLYNLSFEKAARLLAKAVLAVFARVCVVFGPVVPGLPSLSDRPGYSSSGPMDYSHVRVVGQPLRHSAPILRKNGSPAADGMPPATAGSTLGAAGVALRYADIIITAQRLLTIVSDEDDVDAAEDVVDSAVRDELYDMLPAAVRAAVRAKLIEFYKSSAAESIVGEMAAAWRDAARGMLRWLTPMAEDTRRWQDERSMERERRFDASPRAFKLQTLHCADREKAEAAVVEVLVSLSCICYYNESRRRRRELAGDGGEGTER